MFRWRLCLDGLTVQEDWKWYRVEVYYLIFLILMGICESMGSGGVDMCAAEQTPAMCATGSCYLCARGEAHKYGEYVHFLRRGSGRGSVQSSYCIWEERRAIAASRHRNFCSPECLRRGLIFTHRSFSIDAIVGSNCRRTETSVARRRPRK